MVPGSSTAPLRGSFPEPTEVPDRSLPNPAKQRPSPRRNTDPKPINYPNDPLTPQQDPPQSGESQGSPAGTDAFSEWFEQVWNTRDDEVYREVFGVEDRKRYPAWPEIYEQELQIPPVVGGWLHHTVVEVTRTDGGGKLYATSGLSNPWNLDAPGVDPGGMSGVGFELMLETEGHAPWAIHLLHKLMAIELLVATGRIEGAELFEYGNHVPLGGPITNPEPSELTWLMLDPPRSALPQFELPSGRVDLMQVVGMTAGEQKFAMEKGNMALTDLLQRHTPYPLVDPLRGSLIPG